MGRWLFPPMVNSNFDHPGEASAWRTWRTLRTLQKDELPIFFKSGTGASLLTCLTLLRTKHGIAKFLQPALTRDFPWPFLVITTTILVMKPDETTLYMTAGWWFGCHFLFSQILGC